MTINRRKFLGSAAALLATSRLSFSAATADGFIEVRAQTIEAGLLEKGSGSTSMWSFGSGAEPAVVHAKQGSELKLRFVNELPQEIWLHFFGVRGPFDLMTINVPADATNAIDCVFTPPDAGTFWIGPVADASRTRDMGLYAMLVVEEISPPEGIVDQVIVLDDWKLDDDGAIEGNFGDAETMVGEGRLGNWFTVNGKYRPEVHLAAGTFTRLRFLNAANVRTMGVLFKGPDPLLIARDGQPLQPAPLGQKALLLAPGQRADLLVSADKGDTGMALDLFEDIVEIAYLIGVAKSAPPVIADNFALPANPVSPLPAVDAAKPIALIIEGGIKGGLKSARLNGVEQDLRVLLENGKGWALNGVAGPGIEPLFSLNVGDTVVLEVDNRTAFAQPLHIHGHVWQAIAEEPSGEWMDTAVVASGRKMRLAFVADNPGTWAIQSLVAERADGGMIGAFIVLDQNQ